MDGTGEATEHTEGTEAARRDTLARSPLLLHEDLTKSVRQTAFDLLINVGRQILQVRRLIF